MVYCGGLENRFGFTADGGSNPSLSAKHFRKDDMNKDTIWLIVWAAVILGVFIYVWRAGHLARFANYVMLTREELRKCTWPTWDELKGSTMVVTIAIIILGVFTVLVDYIFTILVSRIT